jgi:hypothetical protein
LVESRSKVWLANDALLKLRESLRDASWLVLETDICRKLYPASALVSDWRELGATNLVKIILM